MQDAFKLQLDGCKTSDRYRFLRRFRSLQAKPNPAATEKLAQEMQRSSIAVQTKREQRPKIEYDLGLPVNQKRDEILELIANHQVVVIAGETGSGKTTQLPKMCLELGLGCRGFIGHTQPRRIAARSVSNRIAEELKVAPGTGVGYKIRFNDKTQPQTFIKVMTDGILLSEAHHDRFLSQYEVIIIDEAHERSLNIDFILGYIKRILPQRPDLKVIITSATIDPERFSKYFNNAPILEVSGRTYPVEVRYRPLLEAQDEKTLYEGIIDAVEECFLEGPGDVLVFLSGEGEIREAAEALRKHHWEHVEVLPLYARLSAKDQHRIFESHPGSRIILSTNVAETSLTVPGIRYVIDSGKARVSRYSYRSQIQRLPIEAISQASAKQRAGRCGRVMSGVCIRLYAEDDFANRAEFTEPEILRTNLAAVILQMLALGLGHIDCFPFVEAPDPRFIRDGLRLLMQIGAIDERHQITTMGRKIAKLPIDPRLAVMLYKAETSACLEEILVITSFLSIPDPREWPLESRAKAQESHARFNDKQSDFMTVLNVWAYLQEKKKELSKNKFQKLCLAEYMSAVRVRNWLDVYHQLLTLMRENGAKLNTKRAEGHLVHQALMAGLVMNVGMLTEELDYKGVKAKKFKIFPGSAVKKKPKWIMAFEIFETQQVFARMVASVDVKWVESAASHLLSRQYSEPSWNEQREQVLANERASFYGLPIYHGRKVQYTRINPQEAREIMIREALVEGRVKQKQDFLSENLALIDDIEVLESKSRRRDILVDSEVLYAFYEQKIPENIVDYHTFKKWLKEQSNDLLRLTKDALMQHEAEGVTETLYPEQLDMNAKQYTLSYCFEPSEEDDGVTVYIPAEDFPSLTPARFDWLVPGLLEEKVIALIKSLPKQIRTHFVPAPEFAKAALERMSFGQHRLIDELSQALTQMTGVIIPEDAWQPSALPKHLKMIYVLLDNQGRTLCKSREWSELRQETKGIVKQALQQKETTEPWQRTGITAWDFDDLPETVTVERQGIHVSTYPRLKDDKDSVKIELFTEPHEAAFAHQEGLRRLIYLTESKTVKYLKKNIPRCQELQLLFSSIGGGELLQEELVLASIQSTFLNDETILQKADFQSIIDTNRTQWVGHFNSIAEALLQALKLANEIKNETQMEKAPKALHVCYEDCRKHLASLIYPHCLRNTDIQWIQRLPIYLQGIKIRVERARQSTKNDAKNQQQLRFFTRLYEPHLEDHFYLVQEAFIHFRWLCEEFALSLFAQKLKTIERVSIKRLEKAWAAVTHRLDAPI